MKFKAFTIIEMVITMLLTGIVISIAFTAYMLTSRTFVNINFKNGQIENIAKINEIINLDFTRAKSVFKTNNGIAFVDSLLTTTYEITDDHIVRKSTVIDTFYIKVQSATTFFENHPVEYTIEGNAEKIDLLNLLIQYDDHIFPYHYYKHYSSTDLFEDLQNANN